MVVWVIGQSGPTLWRVTMAKLMIEIADVIAFRRGGEVMNVTTTGLSSEIVAQLVAHGLTQKVGDAAAGKSGKDARDAMQAVIDTLNAGDWGRTRGGGSGEEPWMRYMRRLLRERMGEETKAEYKELAPEDRDEFLNGKFAALPDETRAKVEAAAKRAMEIDLEAKKAAKKAGVDDFTL